MTPRGPEAGFTLIETLVALAVFSLAVLALLNLTGENTRAAGHVEARWWALVVAENRTVEAVADPAQPPLGEAQGVETAGGRDWRWTRRVEATPDPDVLRVRVAVRGPDGGQVLAELDAFRSVR